MEDLTGTVNVISENGEPQTLNIYKKRIQISPSQFTHGIPHYVTLTGKNVNYDPITEEYTVVCTGQKFK